MQFAKKKCAVLTTTTIELSFLISFMVIRKDTIKSLGIGLCVRGREQKGIIVQVIACSDKTT